MLEMASLTADNGFDDGRREFIDKRVEKTN